MKFGSPPTHDELLKKKKQKKKNKNKKPQKPSFVGLSRVKRC
jgi:hypothetical protein